MVNSIMPPQNNTSRDATLLEIANGKIQHLNNISCNLFGFMIVAISAIWGFFYRQILNCFKMSFHL